MSCTSPETDLGLLVYNRSLTAGWLIGNYLAHLPGTVAALALTDPYPGKPSILGTWGWLVTLSGSHGRGAAGSERPVQSMPACSTGPSLAIALEQEKGFLQTRMEFRELKRYCLDVPKIS